MFSAINCFSHWYTSISKQLLIGWLLKWRESRSITWLSCATDSAFVYKLIFRKWSMTKQLCNLSWLGYRTSHPASYYKCTDWRNTIHSEELTTDTKDIVANIEDKTALEQFVNLEKRTWNIDKAQKTPRTRLVVEIIFFVSTCARVFNIKSVFHGLRATTIQYLSKWWWFFFSNRVRDFPLLFW